jgi:transposase
MAFQTITTMKICEILRRWHAGQSVSNISVSLHYDRKTVREYINKAIALGLTFDLPLPPEEDLAALLQGTRNVGGRTQSAQSFITPFKERIIEFLRDKHHKLKPKSIYEVLCEQNDEFSTHVSYSSFKRYIRIQKIKDPRDTSSCRIETPPGQQVQIDYGEVGLLFDPELGRRRKLYAFIGTLGFSRHKFVDIVFSQNKESFIASHVRMFDYFGGVPRMILVDNLKDAVIKPDLYDPELNPLYRELGAHYDTFIEPCRVRDPQGKGKVERDVPTVREAVHKLIVTNPTVTRAELNQLMRRWLIDVYGMRDHGTTFEKPFVSFTEQEQPTLKRLPLEPFEIAEWKQATIHSDHYIQFNKQSYSMPTVYIGRTLWVRGNGRILSVFDDSRLIRHWPITKYRRHTNYADFPANVGAALDDTLHQVLFSKARAMGPNVHKIVQTLMREHAFTNLRCVQGIVALSPKHEHASVDRAAAYILDHHTMKPTPKLFQWVIGKLAEQEHQERPIPVSEQTREFIEQGSLGILNSLAERAQ